MFFLSVAMVFASLGLTQLVRGPIGGAAPGVLDGNYIKETIPTKRVVPMSIFVKVMWDGANGCGV